MTIIHRTTKAVQYQSHRTENWLGGDWADVPPELEARVHAAAPDCELSFDENGVLTAVIPTEKKPDLTAETETLKAALEATDYQVIKCAEYQLAGLELPYDLSALHLQRQALRDRINMLEEQPAL